MEIAFLPLDERPCNWKYGEMMAAAVDDLHLNVLPLSLLGRQKRPAELAPINDFLLANSVHTDVLVLALDTFFYGGLIPSRTHHLQMTAVTHQLELLRRLKAAHPGIKIYASMTIMRSPAYNSAAEEPDYYADYGLRLHRRAYLMDKRERHDGLSDAEATELAKIAIPDAIVQDYETRRRFNRSVNQQVLTLVKEGTIDFLVIPQDDSAPFGYTALDQQYVYQQIKHLDLEERVNVYPGADEVGTTLITRAYLDHHHRTPKIFLFFSSTLGPSIVPLYEDRPMLESLKYHTRACGAQLVPTPEEADLILAVNSPGKVMQRAKEQIDHLDISYVSYRDLNDFVLQVIGYLQAGKKVSVCDSAFGNGGDLSLIKRLDRHEVLAKLWSYAGWNTNANTLGTVLADSLLKLDSAPAAVNPVYLAYRIVEDVLYQTVVRQTVLNDVLPRMNVQDYHLGVKEEQVTAVIAEQLNAAYGKMAVSREVPVTVTNVALPWHRLFEINFDLVRGSIRS
ncbi:DUF4127 family protein [Schleiferilactobacillus harbinensis]|jgi:hypothetical protein|uniref:DUF4127 family protein n=1 Tax=Schleiferilactobacillus harbinensis TaxID=304207 RepID=UPI001AAEB1FD|nr:DUF4127 family protein [Schleiferilactobacillus harbinensis]MBO3092981.1 DUF4127 family protein [Schleiferilactobacillus harbinensis]